MIPTRWVKLVAAVLLLPVVWVVSQTFFTAFHRATVEHEFWLTEEFWFFGLGAALWTLWFSGSMWLYGEPRPLRVYVFGHELTHAIWVWLWRGRVTKFEGWNPEGGYVVTDTHNFWIALAPYFYPIYSIAVVLLFAVTNTFVDLATVTETFLMLTPLRWLFLMLGATWAFNFTFTLWMIPKGQTDLSYHGNFFSGVIIYLMNILLLALLLVIATPKISFRSFGRELLGNAEDFAHAIVRMIGT